MSSPGPVSHPRRVMPVLAAVLVVAGCSVQVAPADSDDPASVSAGCAAPTQVTADGPFGPEIEGSSEDGLTLFGLIQASEFLIASDAVKKVVWRVSGSGEPTVKLVGPDGEVSGPSWGPEYHPSSNYDRPGNEYGSGLILDKPGCWHIEVTRNSETASVWLLVGEAEPISSRE